MQVKQDSGLDRNVSKHSCVQRVGVLEDDWLTGALYSPGDKSPDEFMAECTARSRNMCGGGSLGSLGSWVPPFLS